MYKTTKSLIFTSAFFVLVAGCDLPIGGNGNIEFKNAGAGSGAVDVGGARVTPVKGNSSETQTVTGSRTSRVGAASATFPPNTLAIDTSITIQEGASLEAEADAELAASSGSTFTAAGPAVLIIASEEIDAKKDFEVSIPVSQATPGTIMAALLQDPSKYAVVYKVRHAADGKTRLGVIPGTELVLADGTVKFFTRHFGVFQLMITSSPLKGRQEVDAASQVLTAIEQTGGIAGTEIPPPAPFRIQGPEGAISARELTVTWERSPSPGVVYDLVISNDQNCTRPAMFFFSITGTQQKVVGLPDGAYFLCVDAKNNSLIPTHASNNGLPMTLDTTPPRVTFEGLPEGPSGKTRVVLRAVSQSEAVAGVRHKILTGTDDFGCRQEGGYSPSHGPDFEIDVSTQPDGPLIFCAMASDALGNADTPESAQSFVWQKDTVAPPAVDDFRSDQLGGFGKLRLLVELPDDPFLASQYARIEIRGQAGSIAPTDCQSGDQVARFERTQSGFSSGEVLMAVPEPGPGAVYSTRLCLYDNAGNIRSVELVGQSGSENLRIFVSSQEFNGNLKADFDGKSFSTGFEGADYRCQYMADEAKIGGRWKAVLGDGTHSPNKWLRIPGPVVDMSGAQLYPDADDMFDGINGKNIAYDEYADTVSNTYVWTGSDNDGDGSNNSCDGWTRDSGGSGQYGENANGSMWLYYASFDCSQTNRVYCVEQPPLPQVLANHPVVEINGGDVSISLDFKDTSSVGSIHVLRGHGAPDAQKLESFNPNCDPTSAAGGYTEIKSYDGQSSPFNSEMINDNSVPDGQYHYMICAFDKSGKYIERWIPNTGVTVGTFHRVFVSSLSFDGNLGGLGGADAKCQDMADDQSLGGTWKAILSGDDSSVNATARITVNNPVYDMRGNFLAIDSDDFWDGSIGKSGIRFSESGINESSVTVWTGSNANGTYTGVSCDEWTTNSSGTNGKYGYSDSSSSAILSWHLSCDFSGRLYCINGQ